jgi:hypothetical protein
VRRQDIYLQWVGGNQSSKGAAINFAYKITFKPFNIFFDRSGVLKTEELKKYIMISYIAFNISIYNQEREADTWLVRPTGAHGADIGKEKRETVALSEPIGVKEQCKGYWPSKGPFS